MASKMIRGITVEIGGDTTKLGKALQESEKQSRLLQSELKFVNDLLKFDPGNTELLAQKQKLLTDAISETTTTLTTLQEAQGQVKKQFENGEIGEDQYRAFQRQIVLTQQKISKLTTDLESMDTAVDNTGSESSETATELKKLTDTIDDQETKLTDLKEEYTNVVLTQGKNSKEAKALAKEMESLNEDLKDNKDRLSKAEKQADKFAGALDDVDDSAGSTGGFTVMKGALADLTANAISSAVSAIGDFIGSLMELDEATEEYRSMQGKLEGSAETFGYSADFARRKYETFYKYLGDDQAATNAITNLMGLGTSTRNVSDLAKGAIGVWASYGDSIPIESLTESINETVQAGKVTGTFADTINWSADAQENLKSALSGNTKAQKAYEKALKRGETAEDAFNAALAKVTDEQERADIVAKFLNDTYGESKEAYDEMNKSILDSNEAELKLKDTQAKLGEAVAPVNTAITNLKNKALEAIVPVVEKLADGFMNVYNWLKKNPTAMAIVTAVVIALATAFGVLAAALAIQMLITGVTKAFALLNATILANPSVLIVALIAGLVAAFIYLWNNCEGFRQFWIRLWDRIKSIASTVVDALKTFFTETIPNAWNTFIAWLPGFINGIVQWFVTLPGKIWTWLSNVISKIGEWGSRMWSTASRWVSNLVSTVVNWFMGLPGKIWTWLSNIISKVTTWGSNLWNKGKEAASTFVNNVVQFFRELPGKIATWLSIVIGRVSTWATTLWNKGRTTATIFVNNVVTFIKRLPGQIWTWLKNAASKVGEWATSLATMGKRAATKLISVVVNNLKNLPGKLKSVGSDVVKGLWNGIKDMGSWIGEKIKGFGSGVLNSLKNFFGIASPSKLMRDEVGRYIAEGIGVGIEKNSDKPINAMKTLADEMADQEYDFNDATIERKLATTFKVDNAAQMDNNAKLLSKLDSIYDRLNRLQIVLDSGTLVGETIDKIDAALATNQLLRARGV